MRTGTVRFRRNGAAMKTSVELQDTYSYMILWLIAAAVLVAAAVVIFVLYRRRYKRMIKEGRFPRIVPPSASDIKVIRMKYLRQMDDLYFDYKNNKTDTRNGYRKLSKIIRMFVYEATKIRVQDFTLSEISMLNMPALTSLVSEYYEPEFAKDSKADILISMNRTRDVIEKWR